MSPAASAPPKLILLMSASLDGFLAREAGVIDWLSGKGEGADAGAARHAANLELIARAGTIVLGRGAHDEMAPAWSGSAGPMAGLINSLPKVVFSSTAPDFQWENARATARPCGGGGR